MQITCFQLKVDMMVGSYDFCDQIHGTITFRKAEKGEEYTGIGKDFLDMENMLVQADEGREYFVVLCQIQLGLW